MKSQHRTATAATSNAQPGPEESRLSLAGLFPTALPILQRYSAWIAGALILAPVLLSFYYVNRFGVNVVWEDQWGLLPVFMKHDAGTLTLLDFWKQHNEHRHCIPKMVMYALAFATRWNVVAEMWVSQAMLLGMLTILLSVLWRECASKYRVWAMVPVACLTMGLRQSQNMLFGWQIGFVMIATSAVAALYCLYLMNRPRLRALKFAGAVVAATVATCSGGSGPLVWIAGLVPLELLPIPRRSKTVFFVSWACLGMAAWFLYFWGYQQPKDARPLGFSPLYGLAYLGGALYPIAPLSGSLPINDPRTHMAFMDVVLPLAIVAGAIIVLLALVSAVVSFTKRKGSAYSLWLGIILYALLAGGATTVGRSAWGIGEALATRYSTFSGLAVIGIYCILTSLASEYRGRPIAMLWGCLFSLIVSGLVLSTIKGFETAAEEKLRKEYRIFVLATADTQPDDVLRGSTNSPEPREGGVALLKKYGWNVFAPGGAAARYALPSATLPVLSAPAQLSPPELLRERDYLLVRGCALNTEGNDVVGDVFLELDGKLYPTYYGVPRPEVVQAFREAAEKTLAEAGEKTKREAAKGVIGAVDTASPNVERARRTLKAIGDGGLDRCGFERAFPLAFFAKGRHRLGVKVLTRDGKAFFASPAPMEFDTGG